MFKHVTRVALVLLVMSGFLAACGDDSNDNASTDTTKASAQPQELKVAAKEYSFTANPSVKAGYVKVTLENQGKEHHQAQFVRINDGVTPQQLQDANASDPSGEKALALVTVKGGVNGIEPGASQSVVSKLDPGSYLMMCFLSGPDGKTHVSKGMVMPFTVAAPATDAGEPSYKGEIEAKDFTFDIPTLKAGETTIEFKNSGPSSHEGTLLKLAAGKTQADALAFLSAAPGTATGPPPVTDAGGSPGIAPGTSSFPTLNLEPGNYVMLCFIPDPKTHKPHFALGMIKSFEVK